VGYPREKDPGYGVKDEETEEVGELVTNDEGKIIKPVLEAPIRPKVQRGPRLQAADRAELHKKLIGQIHKVITGHSVDQAVAIEVLVLNWNFRGRMAYA